MSATINKCTFRLLENVEIVAPDTFIITLQQRTLHKFEPDRNWKINWTSKNFGPPDYLAFMTMAPMGWWHITFDKTKDGVHSVIYDSIYMDMGATEEYYLPW